MFSSVFSTSKQQQEKKEKPIVHWNELAIDDVVRCVCVYVSFFFWMHSIVWLLFLFDESLTSCTSNSRFDRVSVFLFWKSTSENDSQKRKREKKREKNERFPLNVKRLCNFCLNELKLAIFSWLVAFIKGNASFGECLQLIAIFFCNRLQFINWLSWLHGHTIWACSMHIEFIETFMHFNRQTACDNGRIMRTSLLFIELLKFRDDRLVAYTHTLCCTKIVCEIDRVLLLPLTFTHFIG